MNKTQPDPSIVDDPESPDTHVPEHDKLLLEWIELLFDAAHSPDGKAVTVRAVELAKRSEAYLLRQYDRHV